MVGAGVGMGVGVGRVGAREVRGVGGPGLTVGEAVGVGVGRGDDASAGGAEVGAEV